jgi:WXG100 family type VII secretion target
LKLPSIGDAQLKVTPEVMRIKAADFAKKLSQMQQSFDGMESKMNDTGTYWVGDAHDTFADKYQGYKPEIEEIINRLKEHVTDLNTMAGVYEEAESAVKNIIEDLPADVII